MLAVNLVLIKFYSRLYVSVFNYTVYNAVIQNIHYLLALFSLATILLADSTFLFAMLFGHHEILFVLFVRFKIKRFLSQSALHCWISYNEAFTWTNCATNFLVTNFPRLAKTTFASAITVLYDSFNNILSV